MIVRKPHVQCSPGPFFEFLLPGVAQIRSATPPLQNIRKRTVQRPRVVEFECLHLQVGFVSFCEHEDIRLNSIEFRARLFPEISRNVFRNVTAKTVQVEFANPILEHVSHVLAQPGIVIVQFCHVVPIMWITNSSASVVLVPIRMLHHHAVP